jgi:hypothetical protein
VGRQTLNLNPFCDNLPPAKGVQKQELPALAPQGFQIQKYLNPLQGKRGQLFY